jgi:C-terminal processing protease CtpA/Prc
LFQVTPGTVAAGNLSPGDLILKIGNVNATNITHNEAQEVITGATNILQLTIKK